MKKLIYFIALSLMIVACSKEDQLENNINFEDVFVIVDDPNDPVQHERYNIYKEFNVPVYFSDTIASKKVGTDFYGNPIIRYETVDLKWNFDSYDQNAIYKYDFLKSKEEQLNSLKFIREYLEISSVPMRPFSVLLTDTLTVGAGEAMYQPIYHVGYRTLVLSQIKDIVESDSIAIVSGEIIRSMITDKVSANRNLCARFAAVSSEKKWYDKSWKSLGAENLVKWYNVSWTFSPNYLFHGPPYSRGAMGKDFAEQLLYLRQASTMEEAEMHRDQVLREMGDYGFIIGSSIIASNTPQNADVDRAAFMRAILYLGADAFTERYGNYPVIMKKYTILHHYITMELGVEL